MKKPKRHIWEGLRPSQKIRSHAACKLICKDCGCTKEWVKGIPKYNFRDTVYDKIAPACLTISLTNSSTWGIKNK